MLDAPGQPFYDPEADAALFKELEASVSQSEKRVIRRLPYHINDHAFASVLVEEYRSLAGRSATEEGVESLWKVEKRFSKTSEKRL